ncbi:MAG TPA: GNAT family N-acetyltransferase [Candidatus Tectomicrobia bacterium]|nr:GNAT family N-acetyltransferase [Candidatus Tectomicrobia bacterium]
MIDALDVRPLTPDRWQDLETLFGPRGASDGCWCMWWRQTRAEFEEKKGEENKRAFRGIVASGQIPGLLAYVDGRPAGWCAVQPRDAYARLDRSRTLKRVDEQPVWSVVCFFVAKAYRRRGLTTALLEAAVRYAVAHGARIVEGYPVDPGEGGTPDPWAYTGLVSAFRNAGFVEVARHSPGRPIMRYVAADA